MSSRPPALRLGALPSDDHPVLTQSLLSLFAVVFVLGPASFGVVVLLVLFLSFLLLSELNRDRLYFTLPEDRCLLKFIPSLFFVCTEAHPLVVRVISEARTKVLILHYLFPNFFFDFEPWTIQ